jgi:hypothetical protein
MVPSPGSRVAALYVVTHACRGWGPVMKMKRYVRRGLLPTSGLPPHTATTAMFPVLGYRHLQSNASSDSAAFFFGGSSMADAASFWRTLKSNGENAKCTWRPWAFPLPQPPPPHSILRRPPLSLVMHVYVWWCSSSMGAQRWAGRVPDRWVKECA